MAQSSSSTFGSSSAGDPYLPSSGNGGYTVLHYDLSLDYRVATNRLSAVATITAEATMPLDRFSLDFSGLAIDKLTVSGARPAKLVHAARKVVVTTAARIAAGQRFEVVVRYRGAPRPLHSEWGELGWEELTDGVIVASQPNGASSWFPCNDHPSDKATFRISITCESPYTVLANGSLVSKAQQSGRTTWTYIVRQPMATYLASLQIGRYRSKVIATEPVDHTIFYPANHERQSTIDFARLAEMTILFSSLFGPYPFESYAVVVTSDDLEIPLEAHGLAVFGRNHIDGNHSSDRLIAHELAHQWFGNSLTVARWQDIWLQEGFACYAEWLWSEHIGGQSADDNARYHRDRLAAKPTDLVIGDPGPNDMFDDRVYKRGALALHTIRRTVGDERFFDAVRAFTAADRYANVSTTNFVEFFTAQTGDPSIKRIVKDWVLTAALPRRYP